MGEFNVLWLQSGGCGGCSMSLLNAESPNLFATLDDAGVRMLWHPSFSEQTGSEVHELLESLWRREQRLDAFCLEGAVLRGPRGTGRFHLMAGTELSMLEWVKRLASVARYTVAIGTCAAYGGVTTGGNNPTDASGMQYEGREAGGVFGVGYRSREGLPVINISGCPIHPDWVTETLIRLAVGEFGADDLDALGRPRSYADHLVHHGCPRNEYYEYKASARKPSDLGCMMENLGCLGTQAHADCNVRLWNGGGSCVRGGYACINCTDPEFEEPGHAFVDTPKVAGIPVGLPTDMPKAWFVALSSLSKAATPERLKKNATSDRVIVSPKIRTNGRG